MKGAPSWTCIVAQDLWAHLSFIYHQFLKNQKAAEWGFGGGRCEEGGGRRGKQGEGEML